MTSHNLTDLKTEENRKQISVLLYEPVNIITTHECQTSLFKNSEK